MDDIVREARTALEEIAYAAVGFAVLGFQRAQVARRRLETWDPADVVARLADLLGDLPGDARPEDD